MLLTTGYVQQTNLIAWNRGTLVTSPKRARDLFGEVALQRVVAGHLVEHAALSHGAAPITAAAGGRCRRGESYGEVLPWRRQDFQRGQRPLSTTHTRYSC